MVPTENKIKIATFWKWVIAMTAFEFHLLSTLAIKCQDDFRIFQFASAIHQQQKKAQDSAEAIEYYLGNGFSIPQHFAKGYDLFFNS